MFKRYPEITEQSTWEDVDEALYQFEHPFYRYCASGAGCDPSIEYPEWTSERERLTRLWLDKHPGPTPVEEKPTKLFDKLLSLFTTKD